MPVAPRAAAARSPFAALTPAPAARPRLGIQSVEIGLNLLKRLAAHGAPMRLRDLAAAAGMSPSKTHRYLASFCRTGLAEQDTVRQTYRLGPYAVELGARALGTVSPVKLAAAELESLAAATGHTVALAVWGDHGATILMLEESAEVVSMNIRPGTTAPLLGSASGMVYAAFLPRAQTAPLLADELADNRRRRRGLRTRAAAEAAIARVRDAGCAAVDGALVPGVAALAVPVFDHRARIAVALLAVGRSGALDIAPGGRVARALRAGAARVARQLGATRA
jgi:DNA-binding IclR family transcriptional regulator